MTLGKAAYQGHWGSWLSRKGEVSERNGTLSQKNDASAGGKKLQGGFRSNADKAALQHRGSGSEKMPTLWVSLLAGPATGDNSAGTKRLAGDRGNQKPRDADPNSPWSSPLPVHTFG